MFGDRYSINCGVKGIQLHSRYSAHPVYAYQLGYRGKYSIVQLLGQKTSEWGISHLDDLIYLFNNTAYYPDITVEDEEYKVSKIMTQYWVNFARTGKPYLSQTSQNSHAIKTNNIRDNSESGSEWTPVRRDSTLESPIDFMNIDLKPKMIKDPFNERVKFWRSLNLVDA